MGTVDQYTVTDTCIKVFDSYKVSKKEFKPFIDELRKEYQVTVLEKRSDCSFTNEWACHNFLYDLHIAREHTKDIDMQYPLTWWEKIVYPLFGWFCKIFIK